MAGLFGVQLSAIIKHLKNIFAEGGLLENSVTSILETTVTGGKGKIMPTNLTLTAWLNNWKASNLIEMR